MIQPVGRFGMRCHKKVVSLQVKNKAVQFKEVIGQRALINRLTQIIDAGRVSHAQLFLGRTVCGSLAIAVAYAQYLNCQNRQHFADTTTHDGLRADSCGECPSCKKYRELTHPDLHFLFPNVAAANSKKKASAAMYQEEFRDFMLQHRQYGTLDQWYEHLHVEKQQGFIREADADDAISILSRKSYEAAYKTMLIWMPERMNQDAANTLLKTLEEPTPNTLMLLVGESSERLLATVVSRVQQVNVPPLPPAQLATVSSEDNAEQAALFVNWMRMLFRLNMQQLSTWVDQASALGRERQKRFLLYAQDSVRACLMTHVTGVPLDRDFGDEKFNASFPTMVTERNADGLCTALDEALRAIEGNAYAKIALMELSFNISRHLKRR